MPGAHVREKTDGAANGARPIRTSLLALGVIVVVAATCLSVMRHSSEVQGAPSSSAATTAPPGQVVSNKTDRSQIDQLQASFGEVIKDLHAEVGFAARAVGSSEPPLFLGGFTAGPGWSTMKVPLAIAALREVHPPATTSAMEAAITHSDNDAAKSLWEGLGDPATAAAKVQSVLRSAGDDHTVVESRKIRLDYSEIGQTIWTLSDQTQFISSAACNSEDSPILELMGNVEADQQWGLGGLPESRFKGGWGPSPSGNYLVRQMGLLRTPRGLTAVALAAAPASGSFGDGTQILTTLADWLSQHLGEMPAGTCH